MKTVFNLLKLKKKKKEATKNAAEPKATPSPKNKYASPLKSAAPQFDVNSFKARVRKNLARIKSMEHNDAMEITEKQHPVEKSPLPLATTPTKQKQQSFVYSPCILMTDTSPGKQQQSCTPTQQELTRTVSSFYMQATMQPTSCGNMDEDIAKLEGLCDALYKHAIELRIKMMQQGITVDNNYEQYLRASSKHGNYNASLDLAEYLMQNHATPNSDSEVAQLLRHAANHGSQKAQLLLLYQQ